MVGSYGVRVGWITEVGNGEGVEIPSRRLAGAHPLLHKPHGPRSERLFGI